MTLHRKLTGFASLLVSFGLSSTSIMAADKVIIISPHKKSIQNEYLPAFKSWYKTKFKTDVEVDWLDQGGSNDDVKFIMSKFKSNPNTSGIDIFWGGGSTTHTEITNAKLADKLNLSAETKKNIPADVGGYTLGNKEGTYIAQALSSFGIFFNKILLKIEKLPEPATWEDLGNVKFKDKIILTDSRKSGTASVSNHIIIESLGWEKGTELLFRLAGNAKQFATTSSDPIKAIVAGDIAATLAIDFYALAKIGDIGADKLGFSLPEGKTVIEGDPVTILKGAPNRQTADRFVEYILSTEGQTILMLPKGAAGGPKSETLGRLAVNSEAYKITEGKRTNQLNPFTAKGFLKYDADKAAKVRKVFDDLLGASMIDTHKELREAWTRVIAKGATPADVAAFSKLPVNHSDLQKLSLKWDDSTFRNEQINSWVKFSKEKFASVAK
ncbi:MAG: extracellular solute-binding protein [Proteobacteria bacterium]|nr:extracellular solute-binding protein [Pseudomonadota bacterium]